MCLRITFKFDDKAAINGDKTVVNDENYELILQYLKQNNKVKNRDAQNLLNLKTTRVR